MTTPLTAEDVAAMGMALGPTCEVAHRPGMKPHQHIEVPKVTTALDSTLLAPRRLTCPLCQTEAVAGQPCPGCEATPEFLIATSTSGHVTTLYAVDKAGDRMTPKSTVEDGWVGVQVADLASAAARAYSAVLERASFIADGTVQP